MYRKDYVSLTVTDTFLESLMIHECENSLHLLKLWCQGMIRCKCTRYSLH